jgi:hypothetical protein
MSDWRPTSTEANLTAVAQGLRADLDRERAARRIVDDALRQALDHITEARLLAEQWLRSPYPDVRIHGADLLQVLGDD